MNMTAVAIVAIVCWCLVELVNGVKEKKKGKKKSHSEVQQQQEIDQLKERVATLEKIVTDDKYSLNREFESLKKDNVA